eukprot:SAG11_NODE_34586_length_271_cov_0.598837_1_plen_52_part_01
MRGAAALYEQDSVENGAEGCLKSEFHHLEFICTIGIKQNPTAVRACLLSRLP